LTFELKVENRTKEIVGEKLGKKAVDELQYPIA